MRLSPLRRFPTLPPGQAQLPRSHPAVSESDFAHRWYTKYRPWLLTISIAIVVAGGSLLGAELKTEWQRREVRELRVIEREGRTIVTTVAPGGGEETKPKPKPIINKAGEEGQSSEAAPPAQAQAQNQVKVLSEKEIQSRNKKIREYVENLEARKKELLMRKEEIAVKVRRLQERMKRKEHEQRERERLGREGGTPTIGKVER